MDLPIIPSAATAPAGPMPVVEGIARVVRVRGDRVWLEPEQTTSCGHCAASAGCGTAAREAAAGNASGIGTVQRRLQARRFVLDHPVGGEALTEGERIVVGVGEGALLSASLTAYGIPLLAALAAGSLAQGTYGEDAVTMAGMAGGLLLGLLIARINARRLAARGDLAPRYLRRARPDETCGTVRERP